MPKGIPVRQTQYEDPNVPIFSVGDVVRYSRLAKKLTQRRLAVAIGSYVTKSGNTVISEYERGFSFPGLHHIYMLTEVLGIEREPFFNLVLEAYYARFVSVHSNNYFKIAEKLKENRFKGDYDFKEYEGRYYFFTKGKIKYHFPKFFGIMQTALIEKGVCFRKIAESLQRKKYIKHKYSRTYIYGVMNGERTPSMKVVIDLCEYFKLDSFQVYSIVIREKALCHKLNMIEQWKLYKNERLNNGT